jgi:hypothetical protein
MWLVMQSTREGRIAFNADNIAYIAEPPAAEAALGIGAAVAIAGDAENVIEVRESFEDILATMARDGRRRKDDHRMD